MQCEEPVRRWSGLRLAQQHSAESRDRLQVIMAPRSGVGLASAVKQRPALGALFALLALAFAGGAFAAGYGAGGEVGRWVVALASAALAAWMATMAFRALKAPTGRRR
jgi:hypothetical protein